MNTEQYMIWAAKRRQEIARQSLRFCLIGRLHQQEEREFIKENPARTDLISTPEEWEKIHKDREARARIEGADPSTLPNVSGKSAKQILKIIHKEDY